MTPTQSEIHQITKSIHAMKCNLMTLAICITKAIAINELPIADTRTRPLMQNATDEALSDVRKSVTKNIKNLSA